MHEERLARVVTAMNECCISQMAVCSPASVFYLTGVALPPHGASAAIYIDDDGNYSLFTDSMSYCASIDGAALFTCASKNEWKTAIASVVSTTKPIGVDSLMASRFLVTLSEVCSAFKFFDASLIMRNVRMIKDADEIRTIRGSAYVNDAAMEKLLEYIRCGCSEDEAARALTGIYKALGAEGCAFEPTVAYGVNSAVAHYTHGRTSPDNACSIVLRTGSVCGGYCAEVARTFFYKKFSVSQRDLYETALAATVVGEAAVRPGVRFCDVYNAVRAVVMSSGYGDSMSPCIGYSVGLEIGEGGDISMTNKDVIRPGMVLSVGPRIAYGAAYGAMVRDTVLVTPDGHETLSQGGRALRVIG